MLTHTQVWTAIDALAHQHSLTPSALAKKAGLDPTTFNKSKRRTADGRLRWPSTESLAKCLAATGATIDEFVRYISAEAGEPKRAIPLIGLAQAGGGGYFDDGGFPTGAGWDEISFPAVDDEHAYALEISGDSMIPLYRDGDIVIVSPSSTARRGDRVVVKTKKGEVLAKELKRMSGKIIELKSLNPEFPDRAIELENIDWMSRIVWSSQ